MKKLPVTHIDHCSVIITDVGRARRFYGGQLGLTEIARTGVAAIARGQRSELQPASSAR